MPGKPAIPVFPDIKKGLIFYFRLFSFPGFPYFHPVRGEFKSTFAQFLYLIRNKESGEFFGFHKPAFIS